MRHYLNQKNKHKSTLTSTGESGGGYMEDIIKEIGLALAQSQEKLDEMLIEGQQLRLKEIVANPQLILPEPSAFVLPEAKLDLNMSIKGKMDSENNFKIETKPHNAENQIKSNVNQEVSSKVSLKFAMVPEEGIDQAKSKAVPSRQEASDIREKAIKEIEENNGKSSKPEISYNLIVLEYIQDSRKWYAGAWDGNELVALLIYDDTTGDFVDLVFMSPNHREIEDITELANPLITSIDKPVVQRGETVTILGENLGALNMSDTEVRIAGKLVDPLEVSLEKITVKITPDLTSGPISVTIGEFTHEYAEPLMIIATPLRFLGGSNYGYFNPENKQGSLVRMEGQNISEQTELHFANGAVARPVAHTAQSAEFKVPQDAFSGPVSFKTDIHEIKLDRSFYLRPFISNVSPKEAPFKAMVRISGNHFSNVTQIRIGKQYFDLDENSNDSLFFIRSEQSLLFAVPKNAGDGWIYLKSQDLWWETNTFFYQVPSILKAPDYLVVGKDFEVLGHGMGNKPQGLYVEFFQQEKIIEASYVKDAPSDDAQVLGLKPKDPLYSDKLRIIRADIASEDQYDETTALWKRKVPVFKEGTQNEQILWCSPTWEEIDQHWQYAGLELISTDVLKKVDDIGALRFVHESKKIGSYFTFYGEFYSLEALKLEIAPATGTSQLILKISKDGFALMFPIGGNTLKWEEDLVPEESLEKLFLKVSLTNQVFALQINGRYFEYELTPGTHAVADIIFEFNKLDGPFELRVNPTKGSYINSIIISQLDSLLIPEFSNYLWDYELSELEEEPEGYQLNPIENFPTTQSSELILEGSGFNEYTSVMINGSRFNAIYDESNERLKVDLSSGVLSNGELYVFDYLNPEIRSEPIAFMYLQGARIDFSTQEVKAGEVISIRGDHFKNLGIPDVYIEKFGPLEVQSLTNQLIEVIAPKLTLLGGDLKLVYDDSEEVSDYPINVSSLNSYDFLRNAFSAKWLVYQNIAEPTVMSFNSDAREAEGYGSVLKKENVLLDDGNRYDECLLVTCPDPNNRYIEGRFEDFYLPASWELIFDMGFLEEATQTDGVRVSIFLETETDKFSFADRANMVYGRELSQFVFSPDSDTQNIAGTLVIRVEPKTVNIDDRLALVKAELNFTHVEKGWTLLFGSDKTNILTIPGIKGDAQDHNMPGSRSFPAVWQDNKGVIWVFGGYGNDVNPRNGRLNDLWKFDGDQWTWVNGLFSTNGHSKFSHVPGEMTTPGGRLATAYWKDHEGTFWLFGGHGYHQGGRQRSLNDLWKFTEEDGWEMLGIDKAWKDDGEHGAYNSLTTMLDGDNKEFSTRHWPLTRHYGSFWFDENTKLLWLFGGYYEQPDLEFCISDLWTFDGTDWQLRNGDATRDFVPDQANDRPSARRGASIWTDDQGILWLFGGFGPITAGGPYRSLNDLWKFDGTSWTMVQDNDLQLSGSFVQNEARPGPREHAALWRDNDGIVWMFGGEGSNTETYKAAPLNDLWKFENNIWHHEEGPLSMRDMGNVTVPKVPNPDSWPSARLGAATWVNPTGWLMMFGGKGYGEAQKTGNKSLGRLQQLWQFSPKTGV